MTVKQRGRPSSAKRAINWLFYQQASLGNLSSKNRLMDSFFFIFMRSVSRQTFSGPYFRQEPGLGIRTKFLPLSDRRPSRGLKFLACPTESRAEPNCPIVRKSARLASRLGSRALFRTNSDTGQPSSRGSRNTFLGIINQFCLFSSNYYFSRAILETVTPSNLDFSKKKKEKIIFFG